ncbi:hypothetical protein LTR53_007100 [Teratosphaeriaceae sp. CCFEE 6253]|nr:hypothetical protein LTR53_007100 [Teratosphaeriaceae sp. CCFEE 6253]
MARIQPAQGAQSSLERIKALNSLPNLDSQLEEAQQLCTHSARADMILRWLLEKLKSLVEFRTAPRSWDLLSTIIRILPPARLATSMGTADPLQIVQDTLTTNSASRDLIVTIAKSLTLMLEVASGVQGAALRALLSVDAAKAASFTGVWLYAAQQHALTVPQASGVDLKPLLQPASQVWSLRKPRGDEDELFARECLVPAAALLSDLCADPAAPPAKRKRHDPDGAAAAECMRTLETLVAKHVFLPARLAFFAPNQKSSSQATTTSLSDRLAPLKGAILIGGLESTALPTLLDIALRCAPATNQRQRTRERPWIEAVFAALLDCMLNEGEVHHRETLVAMLAVVGDRASLSKESLRDGKSADWRLVTQIITLDANVFADRDTATELFGAVSNANGHPPESVETLLQGVAVPVMKAFAKNRGMQTFIELWCAQLSSKFKEGAVWLRLADEFSGLVESSLTVEQVTEIVHRLCGTFSAELSDKALTANTVQLQAILGGIVSSELQDATHADVDALVGNLLPEKSSPMAERWDNVSDWHHCWKLADTAMNLWFPLWAAQQDDNEVIATRTALMFESKAIKEAGEVSAKADTYKSGGKESMFAPSHDARCFLFTLIRLMGSYNPAKIRLYEQATMSLDATQLSAPLQDVRLLANSKLAIRHDALAVEYVEELQVNLEGGKDVSAHLDKIRILVATASQRPQPVILDTIAERALAYLTPGFEDEGEGAARASAGLQLLLMIPPAALQITQRGHALDAVAVFPYHTRGLHCKRLQLLTQILEEPCPATTSIYSRKVLWQLADQGHELDQGTATEPGMRLQSLELLGRLAEQVCGHLLAHQRQSLVRKALQENVVAAETEITSAASGSGFIGRLHHLSVLQVVIRELQSKAKPETGPTSLSREVIGSYANTLSKDIKTLVKQVEAGLECQTEIAVILSAASRLLPGSGMDGHPKALDEQALFDWYARYVTAKSDAVASEQDTAVLVRWTELLSRLRLATASRRRSWVQLAVTLLERHLPPKDHAAVLAIIFKACQDGDAETKQEYLQAFLPKTGRPSATSLMLLKIVIASLSREDYAGDPSASDEPPQAFLYRLLDAVADADGLLSCRRACECLVTVLKAKPFMVNQRGIEATVATLHGLAARHVPWNRILFLDACGIATVLLQQYRSRLQDRLHLLVQLFQGLLSCFFRKSQLLTEQSKPLTPRHARTFARLLQLLCSPPQNRSKSKASDLVDEVRKARAHVGQYVQYVLHHYCSQVLQGTLGEGVREALMPGLWALLEVMEVRDADAVKSLSAAMNNSERAILRSLYDEYKSFGKWKGG